MAKRKNIDKTVRETEDLPPSPPEELAPEDREKFERLARSEDEGAWRSKWRLTLKQRLWAEAYVGAAAGNATKAAKIAGFSDDNAVYLAVVGTRMLKNDKVLGYVAYLLARRRGSPSEVLAGITEIATVSGASFFSFNDKGVPVPDLAKARDAGALGAIQEINVDSETGVITKVKLYSRLKALESLARIHGQLVDKVQVEDVTPGQSAMSRLLRDPVAMGLAKKLAARMGAGDDEEPAHNGNGSNGNGRH